MKRKILLFFSLLFFTLASNNGNLKAIIHQPADPPHKEEIAEIQQGELPVTRTPFNPVELWNYGSYLKLIFNYNIGMAAITIADNIGNVILYNNVNSETQELDINIGTYSDFYMLYIETTTGYVAYAVVK